MNDPFHADPRKSLRDRPWTVAAVLKWSQTRFAVFSQTARLDAEILLAHALNVDRIRLYLDYDKPLLPAELQVYRRFVARRLAHEPVAYILGAREFWSRALIVRPGVLIPRPETELLVEISLEIIRARLSQGSLPRGERLCGSQRLMIADICTGSGAVTLALASELANTSIYATDIDPVALKVAAENIARYADEAIPQADSRVEGDLVSAHLVQSDLMSAFAAQPYFDIITANPPYIARRKLSTLAREVIAFEPVVALDGGDEGLTIIRRLIGEAHARLRPGGFLIMEIDNDQYAAVQTLYADAGFESCSVRKDLAGHERVISGHVPRECSDESA